MSNSQSSAANESKKMPNMLLVVPVIYIALLVGVLFLHEVTDSFMILGLSIPTIVIWFGTLGGVVDSLQGIFAYNKSWIQSFTIWHVFAGLIGAVYGLASYLFLIVIVKASGSADPKGILPFFALAAFTIGYEQSKFHSMMDDVFKIIFKPVKSSDSGSNSAKAAGGSVNLHFE